MNPPGATCRICASSRVAHLGRVEYLEGFGAAVFDCAECGCRFTSHDATVHERLHRGRTLSYYDEYDRLAARCQPLFAAGDADGLKRELERWPKYRFIIDQVSQAPVDARLLELGSSRGYLAAYFILTGRSIRGVDVSADAVASARAAFGEHFCTSDAPDAYGGGPFDIIYHVGVIGCVADPIALTRDLLGKLKPGGRLLFNAPNKNALRLRHQWWMDTAPPPDLITLFPEGFWRRQFAAEADVEETVERVTPDASLAIATRELVGMPWHSPTARAMSGRALEWRQPRSGVRDLLARALAKAGRMTGFARRVAPRPAEFGLLVSLRAPTR